MSEIFQDLQEFRKILCVCPCCNYFYRISDLHLKTKGRIKKTWLDSLENRYFELNKLEEEFDGKEKELRKKYRELGRKKAEQDFIKSVSPSFRKLRVNPFDIKPIFYPVDFIIFDGMEKKEDIQNVIFLSKLCGSSTINELRKQVSNVVKTQNYEWQEGKIDNEGNIEFK